MTDNTPKYKETGNRLPAAVFFFAKIFSEKHKKLAKGVPNGTPKPYTVYDKIYKQNVKSGVVYAKEK